MAPSPFVGRRTGHADVRLRLFPVSSSLRARQVGTMRQRGIEADLLVKTAWPIAKARLLLAEKDDGYRYVLSRELQDLGFEVTELPSAMAAFDHLDLNPDIQAAVLDLRMPMNTIPDTALARMIRYRDSGVTVILMTGHPGCLNVPATAPFDEILLKTPDVFGLALQICGRLQL
jgi:CheY-like chemotaxis protein